MDQSANQERIDYVNGTLQRGQNADGSAGAGGAITNAEVRGRRVYIRRLIDTRTTDEREYSFILQRGGTNRIPVRDYIYQNQAGSIANTNVCAIQNPRAVKIPGLANTVEVTARQQRPRQESNTAGDTNAIAVQGWRTYYRPGDTVRADNKHWICVEEHYDWDRQPDRLFRENNVHTETSGRANHNPEDFTTNTAPACL